MSRFTGRLVGVLVLVVGLRAPLLAQSPACVGFDPYRWTRAQIEACLPGSWPIPGFSPYNRAGEPLFDAVKVQPFANVIVGVPGLDLDFHAFLTLENDYEPNVAQVIVRGGANGVIQRFIHLQPNERIAERLNEWPELAGQLPIGVSVRVRWLKEGNAGVAMHRARDLGMMVQAVEGGGAK